MLKFFKNGTIILRSSILGSLHFNNVWCKASFIKHGNNNSQICNRYCVESTKASPESLHAL